METVLLLLQGVWTGAIATIAWERIPAWRRLSPAAFADDFRDTLRRMDPTMPIIAIAILVIGLLYARDQEGTVATLAWCGLGGVASIIVGSLCLMEPINLTFRRLPAGASPPDATALHARWVLLHRLRLTIAIVSFALVASAITRS